MTSFVSKALLAGAIVAVAGAVNAQQVFVNQDIGTSTTWTKNNTYNLQKQIYVLPGATLTIQAGTVVASTANVGGSLAVCRDANITGTEQEPVIMTSTPTSPPGPAVTRALASGASPPTSGAT